MGVQNAKQLTVYRKAYEMSMRVFELSKRFPRDEVYAMVTQIRRSSRSICLNLREAWAKRRYRAHFISKLTDCDGEAGETDSSLDFALSCGYISSDDYAILTGLCAEIGRMLGAMLQNPDPLLLPPNS